MAATVTPLRQPSSPRSARPTLVLAPERDVGRVPSAATYRRRRFLAAVLAGSLVLGGLSLLPGFWAAMLVPESVAQESADYIVTPTYQVQEGDSLRSIARRVATPASVDQVEAAIRAVNGIDQVHPGQLVVIPTVDVR